MGKQKGKKLTKTKNKHQRETASPSPSGGGDVRGNGGREGGEQVLRGGLPKPVQGRGCAWRDTCFLMRGKGFVAVWVVEGVKVVKRNGFFNS